MAIIAWHGLGGLAVLVLSIAAAGVMSIGGLAIKRMDFSSVIPFGNLSQELPG